MLLPMTDKSIGAIADYCLFTNTNPVLQTPAESFSLWQRDTKVFSVNR